MTTVSRYTVQEVASMLGVSTRTVQRLIKSGALRAERLSVRRWRIPFDAYQEFDARRRAS